MAKFVFSSKEDEILLYNVQQNKVLFDSSELKYKDTILKDVIWKDIAQKVGRTGKYKHKCVINIIIYIIMYQLSTYK